MKRILSYLRRAIEDYHMIEEGDRIAVGVSGGKDSLTLLLALKSLQRFYPKKFEPEAITLDMGLEGFDTSNIQKMCEELGVNYTVKQTGIGKIVFDIRKETNPCSLCAKLRRGALHNTALELGCNKVALGHHKDDVIETFFLSLFFEGRISCFSPVTYLDRKKITLIRPMIYMPEKFIRREAEKLNLPVVFNPCPANGKTKRQYMKELIRNLDRENHGLKERVFGAIQRSCIDGWKINQ
ncbi:MAG: tRNA 2-thiocytidine(32) synthetase TtcA [Clostridiaceae bacterium]|nr:tRNA 2-thiocytidine(32) synthetase TtcA [Clostridiaceae bacterium]